MAMSKGDLVAAVSKTCGCTKKMAGDCLEGVLKNVQKELAKGGTCTLTGFGTFRVSHRAARMGVNPQHPSQRIKIPARNVPTFKAGKNLKAAVR